MMSLFFPSRFTFLILIVIYSNFAVSKMHSHRRSNDEDVPKDVFGETPDVQIDEATKSALISYVGRRLAAQPVKIRGDIEVTCFTYDGIDAIKEALLAGEGMGTKDMPLKIKLIAPPMYAFTCTTVMKEAGLELMNAAIAVISDKVKAKG